MVLGLALGLGTLWLGGCGTTPARAAPPAPAPAAASSTSVPVTGPDQLLAVQDVVHPGDTVFVTTRPTATRACELRIVRVSRVDDTTLYGDEHYVRGQQLERPFAMPLADVASLDVSRPIRGTDGDEDARWGFSDGFIDRVHGKGALETYVLQPLAVAVQVPYYGAKYTYKAVREGLSSGGAGPSESLRRAAGCARPDPDGEADPLTVPTPEAPAASLDAPPVRQTSVRRASAEPQARRVRRVRLARPRSGPASGPPGRRRDTSPP